MYEEITYRLAERDAICRGCDDTLKKGTPLIYTYSTRNRGQNIFFCLECARKIGDLADTQMEIPYD